jgi:D-alanyl-lipoteichoic acid acyltransferase DltB (MBOAT superfamily)
VKSDAQAIRVNLALMLIASGLFNKVVISNTLATKLVDPVFASPSSYGAADTLLAIYGYAAQIYCDFSGYTNIASGCAMLLGYSFPRNFNAPYYATDPQDFWRRWHISLSSWLRDYLYIPLGGSHHGVARTYFNLFITMVLGGLWHGANWTFVIWGALHGAYLITHRYWSGLNSPLILQLRQTKPWPWIARLLLFHAVCVGWVFFRSPSFEIAFSVFNSLSVPNSFTLACWPVIISLSLGLFMQYRSKRWDIGIEKALARWPSLLRGACFAVVIFVIELLGPSGVAPFIYFQF